MKGFISKITTISPELLADLFETASYGNSLWGLDYDSDFYESIPEAKKSKEKYFTTKMADVLLNGGKVQVYDLEAEGELYGFIQDKRITTYEGNLYDVEESGEYTLSMEDILTAINNSPDAMDYLIELDEGNGDMYTASNLLQIIVFGEEIYG